MASPCLGLLSGCSSSCCSSAAPIDSSGTRSALLPHSSSSSSSVSVLSHGGNGVRWAATREAGASMSSSSSSSSSGRTRRRKPSFCVRAGIRAVETYDASFHLQPECDRTLRDSLSSKAFCAQVVEQSMQGANVTYEFTGEIFQPVPWSPTTKFGMPVEFERYLHNKENFTIINVPPNFMFKAKIFKPSRLCAVYKRV